MLANKFKEELATLPNEPQVEEVAEEPAPSTMTLTIELDKRNRNGKKVTLITGYTGSDESLKTLAKELKNLCGAGGSSRCGEILIQGDVRDKVQQFLRNAGYKTKRIN